MLGQEAWACGKPEGQGASGIGFVFPSTQRAISASLYKLQKVAVPALGPVPKSYSDADYKLTAL